MAYPLNSKRVTRVIADYLGYDLTLEAAEELAVVPRQQVAKFINNLTPFYIDWLEKEGERRLANPVTFSSGHYYCIGGPPPTADWASLVDAQKRLLLYAPRLVIPDPLAAFLKPFTWLREFTDNDDFRRDFRKALLVLAHLAPAVDQFPDDVILMPVAFAEDYSCVQEGARADLARTMSPPTSEIYQRRILSALPHLTSPDPFSTRVILDEVKLAGQLCARLGFTPAAAHPATHEALKLDYAISDELPRLTDEQHTVTHALFQYDLPGVRDAGLEDILKIRKNEEAFAEFREGFRRVVADASHADPPDQKQFTLELQQAVNDTIVPRVAALRKAASTSAFEKILQPAIVSAGAAFITYHLTHSSPISTAVGTGVSPANWLIEKLRKRFSQSGRKGAAVCEAYGLLLQR